MAENTFEVIREYLEEAVGATTNSETQLRGFAAEADEEVQAVFAKLAREARQHVEFLSARLSELGGAHSPTDSSLASLLDLIPQSRNSSRVPEEETVHSLIAAFTLETGQCAIYLALAVLAKLAGDHTTETLLREIQGEAKNAADEVFRLIPSRSKIAFNMLTLGEIDPAVETRALQNHVT